MRALTWHGPSDVRVETVPDPEILQRGDVVVRVTSTAICGSDLHLYDGYVPRMEAGDVLGHEFMGEVVDVGPEVTRLKTGDRVVVAFSISCGRCSYCRRSLWSLCDNTNPNAAMAETMYGFSGAGLFGYSHLYGGYAGGQAEYVRVPFADYGCLKVPDGLDDDRVLFLSDILPTGYMAADNCDIEPGHVVAVLGAGPIGQFAIQSAFLLGAERVIAVDRVPERLNMAEAAGAETIDDRDDVVEALKLATGGRGPDAVIDAVGMESHGGGPLGTYDRLMQVARIGQDRPAPFRLAIQACRKGGTVSLAGVYSGLVDKIPMGAFFAKGLQMRAGQCHVQRYMAPLLRRVMADEIQPQSVITHRLPLSEAPEAYRMFRDKRDGCVKVVLDPAA